MAKKAGKKTTKRGTKKLSGNDSIAKDVAKSVLPKVIIGGIAIGGLVYFVINPLLESIGLKKTADEKAQDQATATNQTSLVSPFSPRYVEQFAGQSITQLTKASLESMVTILHDAIGFFTDDENKVLGVFRQLKAKTQVSQIAKAFFAKYQEDLYTYLKRNVTDEIPTINTIVAGLKAK